MQTSAFNMLVIGSFCYISFSNIHFSIHMCHLLLEESLITQFLAKASTGDYLTPHSGGRTILSYGSAEEGDSFKAYTGLIVNCVLYCLFFAWLLIKGEPRYSSESKNVQSYKMYMEKADAEMLSVSCSCLSYCY